MRDASLDAVPACVLRESVDPRTPSGENSQTHRVTGRDVPFRLRGVLEASSDTQGNLVSTRARRVVPNIGVLAPRSLASAMASNALSNFTMQTSAICTHCREGRGRLAPG